MREVYVLMRSVGEYSDRDESPVLATLDKDDCAPPWETADALRKVRTYGDPAYRLVTVRLMGGADV